MLQSILKKSGPLIKKHAMIGFYVFALWHLAYCHWQAAEQGSLGDPHRPTQKKQPPTPIPPGDLNGDPLCPKPNACGSCSIDIECNQSLFNQANGGKLPAPSAALGSGLVVQDPSGAITMDPSILQQKTNLAKLHNVWSANHDEGTFSRIDVSLSNGGQEVGRYASVLLTPAQVVTAKYLAPWNNPTSCGNKPSRTAVDPLGNAYVENRCSDDSNQGGICSYGSVTKIANYDSKDCDPQQNPTLAGCLCIDRNKDGKITTSLDLDGDGKINLNQACVDIKQSCSHSCSKDSDCLATSGKYCFAGKCSQFPQEFFAYNDECLLWTTRLPIVKTDNKGAFGRGLALDLDGYVWAVDFRHSLIYKLDPQTGALLDPDGASPATATSGLSTAPLQGYGLTVDSSGTLWMINISDGNLAAINPKTGIITVQTTSSGSSYGVTIDATGNVWVPNYANYAKPSFMTSPHVWRYSPKTQQWVSFPSASDNYGYQAKSPPVFQGRGITALASGQIWAAFNDIKNNQSWLISFDAETGKLLFRKRLDVTSSNKSTGCLSLIGVDFDAFGRIWAISQAGNQLCSYDPATDQLHLVPVGKGPYTYSDFTGNVYSTITAPPSYYILAIQGCQSASKQVIAWLKFQLAAQTPGASRIHLSYRLSNDATTLATLPYLQLMDICTPGAVANIACTDPGTIDLLSTVTATNPSYIDIRFDFYTDDKGDAPSLSQFNTLSQCADASGSE